MIVLGVAIAGGLGAVLRFVLDGLIGRVNKLPLPVGTFLINVTGSLFLGLVTGFAATHLGWDQWRLILGTGLAGGYTTFSTASVEGANLLTGGSAQRPWLITASHCLLMLVLSLAMVMLGLWLTR
ncbi:hypothetical protein GCM10009785_01020 [Brooklawnia cerclae]|uniref:Fluoride-specific ion channel FluC n=1 Tax=Brooklawnia cerclae TaxID=349934 RepID=A0ABX0SD84_9ACTN|nr:CrcB family protein [Brooklawnia cerclae]NIH56304.1 CrcB protein [Brooklawnia cerclae]